LDTWKDAAFLTRVSLPKYVDVDWAVHVARSSSTVARLQVRCRQRQRQRQRQRRRRT